MVKNFEALKHDLLTSNYTKVFKETDETVQYNAPHTFVVTTVPVTADDEVCQLLEVHFQEGPIKECGVNGVSNEDLIAMVICRLEYFQKSEFSSRDNAMAITKLEEALLWLRKRTINRETRGVIGTFKK